MTLVQIEAAVISAGLAPRGVVRLVPDEQLGILRGANCLVLIGLVGRTGWDTFARSIEAKDGLDHPLDRWSRRIIDELASHFDASAIYPFGGPPFWPFQRWARRAEPLFPSPLGLLIHPSYGLWHSYRGALALAGDFEPPPQPPAMPPCDSCVDRPCLHACPVGAFKPAEYDVATCASWLRSDPPPSCMAGGCLSRLACPIGKAFAHAPDQASFGMRAFLESRE